MDDQGIEPELSLSHLRGERSTSAPPPPIKSDVQINSDMEQDNEAQQKNYILETLPTSDFITHRQPVTAQIHPADITPCQSEVKQYAVMSRGWALKSDVIDRFL